MVITWLFSFAIFVALPNFIEVRFIRLTNITCQVDKFCGTNVTCELKQLDERTSVLNGQGLIYRKINTEPENSISMQVTISRKIQNEWKPWYFNIVLDFCSVADFIGNKNKNAVADFMAPFYNQFTNFGHKCPYLPNENLTVTDGRVDYMFDKFKIAFPNGLYKFKVYSFWRATEKECSDFNVYFVVGEKIKRTRKNGKRI